MKWLLSIPLLVVVALLLPILLNRAPLLSPPGPLQRLKIYLTRHHACMKPDAAWPDLRSPLLPGDEAGARARLIDAVRGLGWKLLPGRDEWLRAEVATPLWHFRDDVRIRLLPAEGGYLVEAKSESRIGQADFAANERHLIDLATRLRESE